MPDWISACAVDDVEPDEMIRFDHGGAIYVIVRSPYGEFFCIDGICSHEHVILSGGLVMDGMVECPKHGGAFDYRSGEAVRMPACLNLKTYQTRVENGRVHIRI